jgi:hypothetical protein
MRALVVYESMFGNTHVIADHIAAGLGSAPGVDVTVTSVHDATPEVLAAADLVVVGGPTHVHGMSNKQSRVGAKDMAAKQDDLDLDPDWEGPGLRDWFDSFSVPPERPAAAFDTRIHASALLTGQASKGIARRLHKHGCTLVVEPESFFVDKASHLEPDEADRATRWGRSIADAVATAQTES